MPNNMCFDKSESWRKTYPFSEKKEGWYVCKKGVVECSDEHKVRSAVTRWYPTTPILVAEPGANCFVPPVCVSSLVGYVSGSVKRSTINIVALLLSLGLVWLCVAIVEYSAQTLTMAGLMVVLAAVSLNDYLSHLRHRSRLAERAMFFYWLHTSRRARFGQWFWIGLGLAIGICQLVMQHFLGGLKGVIHEYGVMYDAVRAGEAWRLTVGAYFHYSWIHFLTNFFLLVLVGVINWALFGSVSLGVFIFGNIVSAFTQMTLGGSLFDNYGGISGGIYALSGFLIAHGVIKRNMLPSGLCFAFTSIVLIGISYSEISSSTAATSAHLGGLGFGVLCGLFYVATRKWRKFSVGA